MPVMSFLKRWLAKDRSKLGPRFENYKIRTGYTNAHHIPYASIEEFFALMATGQTRDEAIRNLRPEFEERLRIMRQRGEPIPRPGSGRAKARFAPNDQIEALRPLVDEFWSEVLGTSYTASFVSNESRFSSWEHYLPGGRNELIQKVKDKYGVDIAPCYDEPIPVILRRIRDASP